ncbi:uncharacterized protein TOT_020000759 [Theileria orientalis strain Shintoku]|uniref:Cytoplasmic tRNA 2-thiolation protein 1 n=1 Tax=Theileria orientalis strain Shintoku TaxID=869250 RepID=J4DPD3_THEOR|nr:uncharacterized protein TOT_020000759 [Theileria orientalis strain Shintoku]BAM40504.1 uncharacterized protein TOT_020000759 [Theileria orientalis strain Shintoku]|eukprot:XP_009690805.1 uncharacterized protein TOT_020000759 [Theileria orientalis strain Shintoku]
MVLCTNCNSRNAVVRRSFTGHFNCKQCFIESFETGVYNYITSNNLISDGDRVCIGVSGGKDSSVLTHVLFTIKNRYNLNWNLYLLAIDEGIKGYRDDSLLIVDHLYDKYKIELKVLNFKDTYGLTMDQVVALIGKKNNCTICGSFRRQILEIGARLFDANVLCTGHNADDMAETVLLNLFRGDLYKLTTSINNVNNDTDRRANGPKVTVPVTKLKRIKPLKYTFEKEIVMYARFLSLKYFSTECIYSPEAYRGHMRSFIKNLEIINPKIILNIIHSGDRFFSDYTPVDNSGNTCIKCGIGNVKNICKPCVIVEQLNVLKYNRAQKTSQLNSSQVDKEGKQSHLDNSDPQGSEEYIDKKLDSKTTHSKKYEKQHHRDDTHTKALTIKYESAK